MNGLALSDLEEKRQKVVLEELLKESETFWGHTRSENHKCPELNRYFYRSLVESKDTTTQVEESHCEMTSDLTSKDLKSQTRRSL